jgi:hypothetical protein
MGKIDWRAVSCVPRWKLRQDPLLLDLPAQRFVNAYAHKTFPVWFVMWQDTGVWSVMDDQDFLGSYRPSNVESREMLGTVAKKRPAIKAILEGVL